ncbi:MAG: hypothetical protein KQI35_08310 [Bacteroidetes bacterium]|nr:hypothetical protein [Bacteroidota bacterium]
MNNKVNIHTIKRIRNISLSLMFVIVLLFPTLQSYFKIIPTLESTEKREPASKPTLNFSYLDPFPKRYESYYNDHFSLRNRLIRYKSYLSAIVFNQSPHPDKVIFGKNNWLFIVKDELETYRGSNLFTDGQIDTIVSEFVYRNQYFNERGITMYLAILPTKYTVYPEYLPFYIDRVHSDTRTDQILKSLDTNSIRVIDLRKYLIDKKEQGTLYFATDNHWNKLGAYYGYKGIIKRIRKDYPVIPPPADLSNFRIRYHETNGLNLAQMVSMQTEFQEQHIELESVRKEKALPIPKFGFKAPRYFEFEKTYELTYSAHNDSLPDLLLIRDSFGLTLSPYLKDHFDTSVYIFDAWKYKLDPEIVNTVQPDIVVYAILESLWDGFRLGMKEETK